MSSTCLVLKKANVSYPYVQILVSKINEDLYHVFVRTRNETLCLNLSSVIIHSLIREACKAYWRDIIPEFRIKNKYQSLHSSVSHSVTPRIVEITSDDELEDCSSSTNQPFVQFPRNRIIALPFNTDNKGSSKRRKKVTVASLLGQDDYYACKTCFKSFQRKYNLQRHEFGCKVNTIFFFCPICSCTYKRANHLADHIRSHEGFKFECKICLNQYGTRAALTAHMKKHKNSTKDKPSTDVRKDGKRKSASYIEPAAHETAGKIRIPLDFEVQM